MAIEGDHFTVNGTPKFLIFVSYFDAVRRAAATGTPLNADFDFFNDHVDGIRIFPSWLEYDCAPDDDRTTSGLYNDQGVINEATWTRFVQVLNAAAQYNLIVDVTLTKDTIGTGSSQLMSATAYRTAVVEVTHRMKGAYPHVVFDLQNEWNHPDGRMTASEADTLVAEVRAEDPTRPLTVSSAFGFGGFVGGSTFAAQHDRTSGWYTLSRAQAIVDDVPGTGTAVHFQEPMPFTPACAGQEYDGDAGHHHEAVKSARRAGAAGWTFHTRTPFLMSSQNFLDQAAPSEESAIAGLRTQSNTMCWGANALSLSPQSGTAPPGGGIGGSFSVSVNGSCETAWSVTSDAAWLSATPSSGSGSGTVSYSAAVNTTGMTRVGHLTVRGRTFTVAQAATTFTPGDFNGDTDTDLVWQHAGTGAIAVWMMNNGATVPTRLSAELFTPQVPAPWKIVGTGDANRDGHTDLFFQADSGSTTSVAVWHMSGFTRLNADAIATPIPVEWRVRAVGDLNADGYPDLIFQHATGGNLAVWFLQDYIRISADPLSPATVADTNWHIVGTGDVNVDGKTDLFWHHRTQGHLSVWYMNGKTQISGVSVTPSPVSTVWQVTGVGDYNRDGKPDLIWQHTDGSLSTWRMNGTQQTSGVAFSPAHAGDNPPLWKLVGPR